jgi:hypothetical protein
LRAKGVSREKAGLGVLVLFGTDVDRHARTIFGLG